MCILCMLSTHRPLSSRSLSQSLSSSRPRFCAACATSFSASCLSNTGLSPAAASSRSRAQGHVRHPGRRGSRQKYPRSSRRYARRGWLLRHAVHLSVQVQHQLWSMHCKIGNRHDDDARSPGRRGTCKHHIRLRLCKGISDRQVGDWLGGRPPSSQASHFRIATTQRSEFGRQRAIGKFLSKCSDVERGYGRVPPARNVQFTFPEQLGWSGHARA